MNFNKFTDDYPVISWSAFILFLLVFSHFISVPFFINLDSSSPDKMPRAFYEFAALFLTFTAIVLIVLIFFAFRSLFEAIGHEIIAIRTVRQNREAINNLNNRTNYLDFTTSEMTTITSTNGIQPSDSTVYIRMVNNIREQMNSVPKQIETKPQVVETKSKMKRIFNNE